MDTITQKELTDTISQSKLVQKYNKNIDRESAFELLSKKISKVSKPESKKKLPSKNSLFSTVFKKVLNRPTARKKGMEIVGQLARGLLVSFKENLMRQKPLHKHRILYIAPGNFQ